jgi:hypothetical protein
MVCQMPVKSGLPSLARGNAAPCAEAGFKLLATTNADTAAPVRRIASPIRFRILSPVEL